MMRPILTLLFLVAFFFNSFGQTKELIYIKNHKLFVVAPKGSDDAKPNLKLAFEQFWKLSDSIIFID